MLDPLLEIHVVWHPQDFDAEPVARDLAEHFHGGPYASLLGGAVEVYMRSAGWKSRTDSPRPIVWPSTASASASTSASPGNPVRPARFLAVVPIVALELAHAVEDGEDDDAANPWHAYLAEAAEAQRRDPDHVRLFPLALSRGASIGERLTALLGPSIQYLGTPDPLPLRKNRKPPSCEPRAGAIWLRPSRSG